MPLTVQNYNSEIHSHWGDLQVASKGTSLRYPALSEKYEPVSEECEAASLIQLDLTGEEIPEIFRAQLPGHGDPGEDCGEGVAYHCNHCGKSFWVQRSCMMRECPHCSQKWGAKLSKESAWRFWTGIQSLYHGYHVRKLHCVVSLPYHGESQDDVKRKVRIVCKEHGVVGGLVVVHPFREDDDSGQFALDGTVHVHIIGVAPGDVRPGTDHEKYGAVFKVIPDPGSEAKGKATYRGFRKYSEVKRCIQYLLSHCGIIEGKHALTWWGVLSYNMLSTGKLKEFCPAGYENLTAYRAKKCPHCGSDDTEPCEELDLIPRIGIHRSFEHGSDWGYIEKHPMPEEPRPLPYRDRGGHS